MDAGRGSTLSCWSRCSKSVYLSALMGPFQMCELHMIEELMHPHIIREALKMGWMAPLFSMKDFAPVVDKIHLKF